MENLKAVNLEQKVETRFCAWHIEEKQLYLWRPEKARDGFVYPYLQMDIYGSTSIKPFGIKLSECILLPYSDNYVVKDGVLYEKSAYEVGTVGYWLDKMDEPERSQAFENMQNPNFFISTLEDKEDSISDAIINAFVWEKTSQGDIYWSELHDKYCREEYGF